MGWRDRLFVVGLGAVAFAVCALMLVQATPAAADPPVMTGCRDAQGPIEWLPGVASTTLLSAVATDKPYTMSARKSVTFRLASAAAGDCFASFDAAAATSTLVHGWPLTKGDTVSLPYGNSIPIKVACTAQLLAAAGLSVLQCR